MPVFLLYIIYALVLVLNFLIFVYMVYFIYGTFKAAPFVPTPHAIVDRMIQTAGLGHDDFMMDLGSGDGRLVKKAAPMVKKAVGVEINPILCWWSKIKLRKLKNVKIIRKNLWNINLSDVDALMVYLIGSKMKKLKQKIEKEMKPGSRIISHGFRFPDWKPEKSDNKVHLYIVI